MCEFYEGNYIYRVNFNGGVREAVVPGTDGYSIYIQKDLNRNEAMEAYRHALRHIKNGDFDRDCVKDVQEIENNAHKSST
jgi:hypothetical protein